MFLDLFLIFPLCWFSLDPPVPCVCPHPLLSPPTRAHMAQDCPAEGRHIDLPLLTLKVVIRGAIWKLRCVFVFVVDEAVICVVQAVALRVPASEVSLLTV